MRASILRCCDPFDTELAGWRTARLALRTDGKWNYNNIVFVETSGRRRRRRRRGGRSCFCALRIPPPRPLRTLAATESITAPLPLSAAQRLKVRVQKFVSLRAFSIGHTEENTIIFRLPQLSRVVVVSGANSGRVGYTRTRVVACGSYLVRVRLRPLAVCV